MFNRKKRAKPKSERLKNSDLRHVNSSESLSHQSSSSFEDLPYAEKLINEVNADSADSMLDQIRLSKIESAMQMSSDNLSDDFSNEVTTNNWETALRLITAKHGTSDAEAKKIGFSPLKEPSLPNAAIPLFGRIKSKHHTSTQMVDDKITSCACGENWKLDFLTELLQVIEAIYDQIHKFSLSRDPGRDIPKHTASIWRIEV